MSDPIDPTRLLKQAAELAGINAGPGRPDPTNHRRAVSAAYYALFHAICLAAARHVLPDEAPDEEVWGVTRWVNHKDVSAVCDAVSACAVAGSVGNGLPKRVGQSAAPLWIALSTPQPTGARLATVSLQLQAIADVFVALYEARQTADCDHSAKFSKQTALGHVQAAETAVKLLHDHAVDAQIERFLAWSPRVRLQPQVAPGNASSKRQWGRSAGSSAHGVCQGRPSAAPAGHPFGAPLTGAARCAG